MRACWSFRAVSASSFQSRTYARRTKSNSVGTIWPLPNRSNRGRMRSICVRICRARFLTRAEVLSLNLYSVRASNSLCVPLVDERKIWTALRSSRITFLVALETAVKAAVHTSRVGLELNLLLLQKRPIGGYYNSLTASAIRLTIPFRSDTFPLMAMHRSGVMRFFTSL